MRSSACLLLPALLSGCAVTSFAPPIVNLQHELVFDRTQRSFDAVCSPTPGSTLISHDVDGALRLISNYALTYRCQRDRAAEGRQFFEVPSMLATLGGATAAAFGAPAGVAIGTGAFSAAAGQGKSYYAPKDKAQVLNDGLAAILCVQNAAVGVDPYTLRTLSAAQADNAGANPSAPFTEGGAQVEISYGRQYFEMIRSSLFSIEEVVAQRLSAAGTPFDAAGVIAEIEKINKKEQDQTSGGAKPTPATVGAMTTDAATTRIDRAKALTGSQLMLKALGNDRVGRTVIKIDELQSKLDKCVVSAKV